MNTNRDSSAYIRKLTARTITMHHLANPVRKGQNTDYAASYMTKVNLGPADGFLKPIYEETLGRPSVIAESIPALLTPLLPPTPTSEIGFIPTTWIDATGVDFNSSGQSVAYGNGKWIAVGLDNTNTIKASTDGITWTDVDNQMPATGGGAGAIGVATDGAGNWVVVGNRNTAAGAITILYSSDNGVTWLSNPAHDSGFNQPNNTTDRGYDVTYANGLWVAVGHYGQSPIQYERTIKIATTFDPVNGPNWSSSPPGYGNAPVFGSSNPAMCVAYGNGVWCVGGQDFNTPPKGSIFYSTNAGTSWTKATGSFEGMCFGIDTDGNGNWVAVGFKRGVDATPIKYSSDNGVTWVNTTTASGSLFTSGNSVKYVQTPSGGVWVAVGSGNSQTILYSTDNGATWSSAGSNRFTSGGNDIYYAGDKWIAVGDGGSSSIKYSLA